MFHRVLCLFIFITGLLLPLTKAKGIEFSNVNELKLIPKDNQIAALNQNNTNRILKASHTNSQQLVGIGRGRIHRHRKIFKQLYPFLMAILFAKLIVVPLILKLLIATTSSAFVMSKIALVTSAIIAISWLLGATRERAKLQIVQYPGASGSKKLHGGWSVQDKYSPQYPYNDWNYDDTLPDSNDKNFFL